MKYILIIVALGILNFGFSQQEAQFSQYYNNPYLVNPAAGGLSKTINADLGFRRQWMGIEGSPQSLFATVYSRIGFDKRNKTLEEFNKKGDFIFENPRNNIGQNKHVVGLTAFNDQIGPFNETKLKANYSFHLRFTKETMLSFGVNMNYADFGINHKKVLLYDSDDDKYDEFLINSANQSRFDMDAGLLFYGEKFQLGLSSMQLVGNKLRLDHINTNSFYGRHWFIYGMYAIDVATSPFSLEPHFMVQMMKGAPTSVNLGVKLQMERKYWVDISYRIQDAISVGAGLNFGRNFHLAYAYDIAIGKVQRMNNYVHEIILGITIGSNRVIKNEVFDSEDK